MTHQHPNTPPPELVQEWDDEATDMLRPEYQQHLTARAAQWGADQELEACCQWATQFNYDDYRYQDELRTARRPRPPSLKSEVLTALHKYESGQVVLTKKILSTIRQTLETLPE